LRPRLILFAGPFLYLTFQIIKLSDFLSQLADEIPWLALMVLLAQACVAVAFYYLLKAPTVAGARLRGAMMVSRCSSIRRKRTGLKSSVAGHHTRSVREISALCHRARRREQLEQAIRSGNESALEKSAIRLMRRTGMLAGPWAILAAAILPPGLSSSLATAMVSAMMARTGSAAGSHSGGRGFSDGEVLTRRAGQWWWSRLVISQEPMNCWSRVRSCRALFLLFSFIVPATAQERIRNFVKRCPYRDGWHSDGHGNDFGSGRERADQSRHLSRLSTTYKNRLGNRVRVRFDVDQVHARRTVRTYTLESISNGTRVRIGDADTIVPRGAAHLCHCLQDRPADRNSSIASTSCIGTSPAMAGFFGIERAEGIIHLPPGAAVLQTASYTGPDGATGTMRADGRGSTVRVVTTAPLGDHGG